MTARLIALSGPLKGASIALDKDEVLVVRSRSIRVQIPSITVSRQHCAIRRHGGTFTIHDLTSYRGTFLNGVPANDQPLAHGDQIAVGDSVFVFWLKDEVTPDGLAPSETQESDLRAQTTTTVRPEDTLYLRPDKLQARLAPGDRTARHLGALMAISAAVHAIHQPDALQKRVLELVLDVIPGPRGHLPGK
jgi:pSer/pThr/pTyr-binding forkhead associated (FHA) protein